MRETEENEPDPLDPRDAAIAELLASGRTLAEVAQELDISVSTVRRAKDKPDVRARIRALRLEAVAAYAGRLTHAVREAVEQLVALSRSGTRSDAVKLRATIAIIELSLQGVALEDLQAELADLRGVVDQVGRRAEDDSGPSDPEPPPGPPDEPPGFGSGDEPT